MEESQLNTPSRFKHVFFLLCYIGPISHSCRFKTVFSPFALDKWRGCCRYGVEGSSMSRASLERTDHSAYQVFLPSFLLETVMLKVILFCTHALSKKRLTVNRELATYQRYWPRTHPLSFEAKNLLEQLLLNLSTLNGAILMLKQFSHGIIFNLVYSFTNSEMVNISPSQLSSSAYIKYNPLPATRDLCYFLCIFWNSISQTLWIHKIPDDVAQWWLWAIDIEIS